MVVFRLTQFVAIRMNFATTLVPFHLAVAVWVSVEKSQTTKGGSLTLARLIYESC